MMAVETLVNSQMLAERLSFSTIQQMNTAAALFCSGNILGAKE